MSGGDGKKPAKPAAPAPPAARPGTRPPPRGTADSAFDMTPVGSKGSVPGLPRVPSVASMPSVRNPFGSDEKTASGGVSSQNLPKVSSQNLPKVSSQNLPAVPAGPTPGLAQRPRRKSNVIQKQLASSGFDQEERTQIEAVMGRTKSVELDLDEEVGLNTPEYFDGEEPAIEVTTRSTWRALKAPVKSRGRRRSAPVLWTVIDQFAVANNPRYQVQNPAAEPRAHLFAWDVSLAMECEIPHNRQGREMTLASTIDWFRFESQQRGWKRIDAASALAAAERGELVFVIPKDPKVRQLAVVRPGGAGEDGKPRVSSAGRPMGNDLSVTEAVAAEVEYYTHP